MRAKLLCSHFHETFFVTQKRKKKTNKKTIKVLLFVKCVIFFKYFVLVINQQACINGLTSSLNVENVLYIKLKKNQNMNIR